MDGLEEARKELKELKVSGLPTRKARFWTSEEISCWRETRGSVFTD